MHPMMFIKLKVHQDVTIEKESLVTFWVGANLKVKAKNDAGDVTLSAVTLF